MTGRDVTGGCETFRGLGKSVEEIFQPGGALSRMVWPDGQACEVRPQQREMAQAVAASLEAGRHLAVEAGTGVGKTLAYLVPLLLGLRSAGGQGVVATFTISLQQQLLSRDIPLVRTLLGFPFKAVLAKGRHNYLCRRRLDLALRRGGDLFNPGQQQETRRLARWAGGCLEGSLQELPVPPDREVWRMVCAEQGHCLGWSCPDHNACFFLRARREVRDALLTVVNHHLFFSELALRREGAGFLPDYRVAVLDEAHHIESVAGEHFGLRLSHAAMEYLLRRLLHPEGTKGLLALVRVPAAAREVQRVRAALDLFFAQLGGLLPERSGAEPGEGDEPQRVIEHPLPFGREAPACWRGLAQALQETEGSVDDPSLGVELDALRRQCLGMGDVLETFLERRIEDQVYWLEREGRFRRLVMRSAPVEVAPILQPVLFGARARLVMTSATLAFDGRLEYFMERVGARECDSLRVGSPFDYARLMRVAIANDMPDPGMTDAFAEAVGRAVLSVASGAQGRTLVLFTNGRLMREVARRIDPALAAAGLRLLMQGQGLDRHRLLEHFRQTSGSVLFGLDSFWTGIDVRGPALTQVVITRLPFAVPTHPLAQARMQRLRAAGKDPFRSWALPEAVLKFRQGVGRLIRTQSDTGCIVILDRRIRNRRYGARFLRALPECPVEDFTTKRGLTLPGGSGTVERDDARGVLAGGGTVASARAGEAS